MVSEMEAVKTNSVNNSAYLASQVTQHTAQSVGVEFVRQYYTMLNVAPGLLYRFYSEDSTFVHGCLDKHGEVVQCVRGQKQINSKIMSLNFNNCHTKIRQVDSVETINSGVVIQVIGELSNNGQPLRRFLQTFVLTPQTPNKYYVRNDIFRYHDEVFGEENEPPVLADVTEAKNENRSEPENCKQVEPAEKDSFSYQSNGTLNSSTTAVTDHVDTANESADLPEDLEPAKESNTSAEAVNTSLVVDVSTESKDANSEEEQLEQVSGGSAHITHSSPLLNEPKTYASMLSKSFQAGGAPPALIPAPSKPAVTPVSSVAPAVPTSSAPTLNNVDTNIVIDVTMNVTAPPTLAPKTTGNFPPQRDRYIKKTYNNANNMNNTASANTNNLTTNVNINNNNNRRNESRESIKNDSDSGEGDTSYNSVQSKKPFPAPDDHQLFIGNLLPNFSEEELAEIFGRYGKIVDIRINRQVYKGSSKAPRNYGFITFEDSTVVDQIVAQKPIFHGNHRYNVEKKQGRTVFNRDDRNRDDNRVRNNQLNTGNLSRNGSNVSNNPSTFQRHGPMNSGGLNQGNYVPRADRRPGQGYQNQGTRTFTGGQSYSNRNTFASGGGGSHPPQNR